MTAANSPAPDQTATNEHASHAAALEMVNDDEYSKYMLQTKNEMVPVLKGLFESVSQVTMFFNGGRDMVLTSLAGYDDKSIILDFGPSSDMNRKALEADKLFCVTQLDKVKIQFVLRGVSRTEDQGRPAFRAAFPENMLRLQRREFFRLTLPMTRPLKAVLPLTLPDGKKLTIDANVADVSGGGIGLVGLAKDAPIEANMEIANVRMELPEVGLITAKIKVCSVMEATNRSGVQTKRAGCEFVNLAGPMLTLIQRYIIKMERERKARETGM